MERPPLLTHLPVSRSWTVEWCWRDRAFIWQFSEHTNSTVYVSIAFDVSYGFLFNQLMESELFISKQPALRHLHLPQHHIHCGRVCTKYYNGLAIRATFIAS